jgi:hypothetical protein
LISGRLRKRARLEFPVLHVGAELHRIGHHHIVGVHS